ncbi:MAG TPA: hypothetical protein VKU92_09840 [Acidimicrobiales bacterium]|nr:hypothetical protein [Acidimicrobiales bacterium]
MSPYIEAGYSAVLAVLGGYAATLIGRERRARGRLDSTRPAQHEQAAGKPEPTSPAAAHLGGPADLPERDR